MRRNVLAAIALALLLTTAGCSTVLDTGGPASTAEPDPAVDDPPEQISSPPDEPSRTIRIAASGEVQTQPDQAILRVAVEATGDNASTVRQRLAENVSTMREALASMGIDGDQITTTDFDIRNQHRFGGPERDRPAFYGRHAFSITLTDLNRTGDVIVTAVESGATSVDDVRFTLSADRRDTLREQALADAMDRARGEARVIASSANLSLAGVGSVQTADVGFRPVRFEAAALTADAGGAPTSIDGGAVTVTARVEVTYNATAG